MPDAPPGQKDSRRLGKKPREKSHGLVGSTGVDLHCQHCGEQIVARGFGKCPGCFRNLPEELKLTDKEKESEAREAKWRTQYSEDHAPNWCAPGDGAI